MASTTKEQRHGVTLTNLDEPLFDGSGATKRDLVDHLEAMADRLLPVLAGRALSVVRTLRGQDPFMQKNLPRYTPDWVPRLAVWSHAGRRELHQPVVGDVATLMWLGNQRCVELHVPLFPGTDAGAPTHLVLDVDPPEGSASFAAAAQGALLVRQALADVGMSGLVKTSGAKGVHVVVPLAAGTDADDAAAATRALAVRAERLDPVVATTAYVRDERDGKVFLDSTRSGTATVAAAYSPRVRPGAPVSVPVPWDGLTEVDPAAWTIRTTAALLGDGDPWAALMPAPQRLDAGLVEEGRSIPVPRVAAMHAALRARRSRSAPTP